jgi:hypothetical protein
MLQTLLSGGEEKISSTFPNLSSSTVNVLGMFNKSHLRERMSQWGNTWEVDWFLDYLWGFMTALEVF